MSITQDRFGNLVKVSYTFKTINNVADVSELDLTKGEMQVLENVDISSSGAVSRRRGYTRISEDVAHSAWTSPTFETALYVKSGTIYSFDGTNEYIIGNTLNTRHAFCDCNDIICFTNGFQYGLIVYGTVTIPTTPSEPFKVVPPAGQYITYYNGRVYIAGGDTLFCTDPFNPEVADTRYMVVATFDGNITALGKVSDGLVVATNKEQFFLQGTDAVGMTQKSLARYGVIGGTLQEVNRDILGDSAGGSACIYASTRGICVVTDGGVFKNTTMNYYQYKYHPIGTSTIRYQDGEVHYLANFSNTIEEFNINQPPQLEMDAIQF